MAAWLDEIGHDVRYGDPAVCGRRRHSPAWSSFTLALGIGANTAIFSVIDALMLRWLPVRSPEQLVLVGLQPPDAAEQGAGGALSYPIVQMLAEQRDVFAGVGGFSRGSSSTSARQGRSPGCRRGSSPVASSRCSGCSQQAGRLLVSGGRRARGGAGRGDQRWLLAAALRRVSPTRSGERCGSTAWPCRSSESRRAASSGRRSAPSPTSPSR